MSDIGIRLEPHDRACRDPRFLRWLIRHRIEPSHTYAVDVFEDSFVAHCYHVNPDGAHHARTSCAKPDDDLLPASMGDVCRRQPIERAIEHPFPMAVLSRQCESVGV